MEPAALDQPSLTLVLTALKPFSGPDWVVFERTCVYIALALAGCIAIGYPVAYYAAACAKRTKPYILALLVAPLLVSYMLRMLAWVGLLSPGGRVNAVLVPLHIVPAGFDWLDGRPVTVIFGLTYGWIPYFIIPLYALSRGSIRAIWRRRATSAWARSQRSST